MWRHIWQCMICMSLQAYLAAEGAVAADLAKARASSKGRGNGVMGGGYGYVICSPRHGAQRSTTDVATTSLRTPYAVVMQPLRLTRGMCLCVISIYGQVFMCYTHIWSYGTHIVPPPILLQLTSTTPQTSVTYKCHALRRRPLTTGCSCLARLPCHGAQICRSCRLQTCSPRHGVMVRGGVTGMLSVVLAMG